MNTEASPTPDIDLDRIMQELDRATNKLPEKALRTVQAHRDLFIPRLIQSLEETATKIAAGGDVPGNSHFFALFLLTEFQAQEAWPSILRVISLPGDGPFDLFGDALTECLSQILASFLADAPDELESLVANRDLYEYVRWEAAQAFLHLVRDGRLTRDEVVRRLHEHLRTAIARQDGTTATILVTELLSYSPHEALEDILTAFQLDLIDEMTVNLRHVKQSIEDGDAELQRSLRLCRPTGIADTVVEMRRWFAFPERSPQKKVSARSGREADDRRAEHWDAPTTVRNTGPRVGRNDPCPCGSGKKYKKCCGAA